MSKFSRRGFIESDTQEFGPESKDKLYNAAHDILYLINRGYNIKNASTYVGDHYLLSARQRLALMRGLTSKEMLERRKSKEIVNELKNTIIHIDSLNTIITLEVALSNSLILKCMDGTIRDLAGLRGTYHLIDKTNAAINLIGEELVKQGVKKAVFYIDAPVSNSGKLKIKIIEIMRHYDIDIEAIVTNQVDSLLEQFSNVITSDSIILDRCISWFNLNKVIIENNIPECMYFDFERYSED
ncbi:hypothetical protein EDD66_10198 [Mobilisporobacter senegalensis]|uniref:DUF434 domain-containing protein n=1 Tax=Mobilisporobacter senegalensis TaxID=1329262 RepID=A0A3N1Y1T4_9FIRM|nr:DUF434 domain-containing protein [Mobilisporobacter senegalensis]ROR31482.1 hypothetical protein EDD66_10198 [Mobilisporobacter senegalensis]